MGSHDIFPEENPIKLKFEDPIYIIKNTYMATFLKIIKNIFFSVF